MALTKAQEREKQRHIKYWTRREIEAKNHYITNEKEYEAELKRIYEDMLDGVQKEIDAFYGRYAKQENITLAEAKKAVSMLDIKAYERKAKRYVKDKDFSKEANEEMRLYNLTMKVNRLEMLKANIGLELISGHDELQKYMENILKGRTMEELERQAGILGKTIKNNAQLANAIVNASFHNAKFLDRVWMHQDLLRNELSNLLQTGLIAGKNPRVLAKEVEKKFGEKKSDAERLMRTELARVQTEAQKQSFERNGFEMYTFLALGDACPICKDIHGKHFKVKDMVIALNAAPMHPHCRCSMAAYEDDEAYNDWLDYLESGGTTEEWDKMTKSEKEAFKKSTKGYETKEKVDEITKKFGFERIIGKHSIEDDIGTKKKPTSNPDYLDSVLCQSNCGNCATAYEMRRRGYDVIARPLRGMCVSDWQKMFKNADVQRFIGKKKRGVPLSDTLSEQLLTKYENGARGSVFVQWKGRRIGHFFSWEIENGKVRFIDGQNGNTDASDYFDSVTTKSIITIRWDNLEPSDRIANACKKGE